MPPRRSEAAQGGCLLPPGSLVAASSLARVRRVACSEARADDVHMCKTLLNLYEHFRFLRSDNDRVNSQHDDFEGFPMERLVNYH
jgi:hypothetical protein